MKILFITFLKNDEPKHSDYHKYSDFYKYADYLNDLTLHGLRELYGEDVIDYPGSWYLYKDEIAKRNYDTNLLWGKGFTYKNILDNYNKIDRDDIKQKIQNNYFNLIVYGSIRRSDLFLEEAIKSKSKIIFIDGNDDNLIKEKYLKYGIYFKREIVKNINNIKSISFSVPKLKITKNVDKKPTYLIAPLIPGKSKTYVYEKEKDYYEMYQKSVFALTYKKVGWDCMRHYEILMNGCIPLFFDINKCPENTMKSFPKEAIYQLTKKYEFILNSENPYKIFIKEFRKNFFFLDYFKKLFLPKIKIDKFLLENSEIFREKEELLSFTKKNLTTEAAAKKILTQI